MNGITVKVLYELIKEQIKNGNGNKTVLISRDDEGNGFHTLFYGFEDELSTISEYHSYGIIDCEDALENIVLLG